MAHPELPVWARITLTIFTALSFLPRLHKLFTSKKSSGISPYYVLSNLLLATNHSTIYLALSDFLNLTLLFIVWLLFFLLFIVTLSYLPPADQPAKRTVVSIYIGFLLISLILQVYDILGGFNDIAHSERDWLLVFFIAGHIAIVNPVLTLCALVSAAYQSRRILRGPTVVNEFSVSGLAAQSVVFALVASPRFVDNAVLDWYVKFGWPVVENAVFAIVHFVILCVVVRRSWGGTHPCLIQRGETEPLLS
ncbi:hypothetical protein BJX70DRAFT_405312 [Aspergillus crustosus]